MIQLRSTVINTVSVLTILSSALLAGCGTSQPPARQSPESADLGVEEQAVSIELGCPGDERVNYQLWMSHYAAIDIEPDAGEAFHLEFQNLDPVPFDLWINPDGSVTNQDLVNTNSISYHGVANHPNSDDCPVQTFAGSWEMMVTITGTCKNDIVRIRVTEEWVDPVLESDCVDPVTPGAGLFSAPELDLTFNLKDEIPSDSVIVEGTGPFQANYTYYLYPAEYSLPIEDLVPEQ